MKIELRSTHFNALQVLEHYQLTLSQQGEYGAMANFIGTMRDTNEGNTIVDMFLEHYPGMTEKSLATIVNQAYQKWQLIDTLVVHRVGNIKPNESIVLVAVWSRHRAAAFEACRYIMEQLKSTAPFWKRETTKNSSHWVEKNTPG